MTIEAIRLDQIDDNPYQPRLVYHKKDIDEELARLIVEFMFHQLLDHGDIGSYSIKTAEPLKWLGINIEEI